MHTEEGSRTPTNEPAEAPATEPETLDDEMLARLLQDEFDREHDAQIHVRQHLQNLGNSKIKISMDLHRLRPQSPPSGLQPDE